MDIVSLFVLNMKNRAQYSYNVLYIMVLLFGGSCVPDHDCMFTSQIKGAIFKCIIFTVYWKWKLVFVWLWLCVMEHFNKHI